MLAPLGLEHTGFDPSGPRATGYYVEPYSDRVTVERDMAVEGPTAAMGWLWSTVDDLALWGDFLATGRDGVLGARHAGRDGERQDDGRPDTGGRAGGGSGSVSTAAATGSSPVTAAQCRDTLPACTSTDPNAPGRSC